MTNWSLAPGEKRLAPQEAAAYRDRSVIREEKGTNFMTDSPSVTFAPARQLTAEERSRALKLYRTDFETDENIRYVLSASYNAPAENGQMRYSATYQLEGEYHAGLNDGNGKNLYVRFDSVGPAVFDKEAQRNPPLYRTQFRFCKTFECNSGVIKTEPWRPSVVMRFYPDQIIYADLNHDGIRDVVFMWEKGSLIFLGEKNRK